MMYVSNVFVSLRSWAARSPENRQMLVSLAFFTIYLTLSIYVKLLGEQNIPYNIGLFNFINGGQVSALNQLMVLFSNYGKEGVWIPVIVLLWIFGKAKHKRSALSIAFALVLAEITAFLSKAIIAQQRPFQYLSVSLLLSPPMDYSYPSGHAIVVASCAVVGVLTLSGYMSIPLLAEALLVSYSRIYTGVHWPIDVLGSWLMGVSIAFLTPKIIEQISLAYGKTNPERGKGKLDNNKIDNET